MLPSTTKQLLFIVAIGLVAVCALAEGDYDHGKKKNEGPCKGGYWPDRKGCCPEIIKGKAYYRDHNKCYPRHLDCGVFYADEEGCYPDEKGNYLKDGECCPKDRKCHERCIRPDHYEHKSTTTEECPKETTSTRKHYTTSTTTEECPKETTSTRKHYTTSTTEECPKKTTSTRKHYTTSTTEECPKETTSTRKETTSTKKHTTTTEECPKETTSTKKHYSTTSEKYDDKKKQCHGGQWSDDGCCPRKIGHQWYYRDAHGCYPIERECGVYYADAKGCYPDENGQYRVAGEKCPHHQQCKRECDGRKKDDHHDYW